MISRWGFRPSPRCMRRTTHSRAPCTRPSKAWRKRNSCGIAGTRNESQLRKAQKGGDAALKRIAKGCATHGIPVDSVTFENGISASEAAVLTRGLNRFRDAKRKAWRQWKSQRDDVLIAQGWDAPEASKAIQDAEFNQVLLDWTTGADVLSAGIAIEGDDLLNSVDALYARADWPGLGTFYSAHSWMGTTVSKRTANWTILWMATFLLMAGLIFGEKVRRSDRPR